MVGICKLCFHKAAQWFSTWKASMLSFPVKDKLSATSADTSWDPSWGTGSCLLAETKDMAKHPECTRGHPQQRMTQCKWQWHQR